MSEHLDIKRDERGILVELFKLPGVGQVFYATSKPGVVRGNHYHMRKVERFCVIEGEGLLRMRNRATGEVQEYPMLGTAPQVVDAPVNWTHSIKNSGSTEMKLVVWVNETYDPKDPDTFPEEV